MSSIAAESASHRIAVGDVYRKVPGTVWFSVAVTWTLVLVLWDVAARVDLLTWAGVLTAVNLGRFAHAMRRLRSRNFLDDPEHEARMLTLGLFITGMGFAIGFLLFVTRAPDLEQYVVTTINIGLCAGAAIVFTGCRFAFIAYALPFSAVMTATSLWFGMVDGDTLRLLSGLVLLLYLAGVVTYQAQSEKALLGHLRLRFEKEELLRRKEDLLAELQVLNKELSADREAFLTASLTDGLTGLANRRHFDRTLSREWDRCRRDETPFACIMLDIDHFKHFNDRYGHMAGDDCLRIVASIIAATAARGGDFAARFGGEEFVVLLPGTELAGAQVLAERIRLLTEERAIVHAGGGEGRVVTLSAGVASLVPSERFANPQSLVDLADEGLYQAKKRGRNRVVVRDIESDAVSLPD